jgi:transposase
MVVIDSAGFTRECLGASCQRQGLGWVIMRVPATVGEAKRRLEEVVDPEKLRRPLAEGYRYTAFRTTYYAEVEQRWLVIYSEAARERTAKQVDKELLKQGDKERKEPSRSCAARRSAAQKTPGGRWRRSGGG